MLVLPELAWHLTSLRDDTFLAVDATLLVVGLHYLLFLSVLVAYYSFPFFPFFFSFSFFLRICGLPVCDLGFGSLMPVSMLAGWA